MISSQLQKQNSWIGVFPPLGLILKCKKRALIFLAFVSIKCIKSGEKNLLSFYSLQSIPQVKPIASSDHDAVGGHHRLLADVRIMGETLSFLMN